MKRLFFAIFFLLYLLFASPILAQDQKVNLYIFYSNSCPHCAKEEQFLKNIQPNHTYLKIHPIEISNQENYKLYSFILQKILKLDKGGVPLTIVGNSSLQGYQDDQTTGAQIVKLINQFHQQGDPDIVGQIILSYQDDPTELTLPIPTLTPEPTQYQTTPIIHQQESNIIKIPLIGNINTKTISLPLLTIIIGILDGFNPCAMWVLIFLISLLLNMQDRKKMWIIGSTFIIASSIVYFLFMTAWLNFFLLLGFTFWIRIAIGLLALGTGTYYLKDYFTNKQGVCKVTNLKQRKTIMDNLKAAVNKQNLLLSLIGIIILAFAVNLIELVCSAGLPAIYTQVLILNNLPTWQYYGYLLLYILFFMIDDLIIFIIAMITLKTVTESHKYARLSHLIGGILIFIIGFLLLFKPSLLTFSF